MIERLKLKKDGLFLVEFLTENFDYDFYYTENNSRTYVTEINSLKKFLKQSADSFVLKDKGDYKGIILLWKSNGGGKQRYYIKINAVSPKEAEQLLTVLLWSAKDHLYIKIRKDSKFLPVFRNKGFKFKGGRGCQILLEKKVYSKINMEKIFKRENPINE